MSAAQVRILWIDDEICLHPPCEDGKCKACTFRRFLASGTALRMLEPTDYEIADIVHARSFEACRKIQENSDSGPFDAILIDLLMNQNPTAGLQLLERLRKEEPTRMRAASIFFVTGLPELVQEEVDLLHGPDFVAYVAVGKDQDSTISSINQNVTLLRRLVRETDMRRAGVSGRLIIRDPSMLSFIEQLDRYARYGTGNVLLLGETGTGKELLARQFHAMSGRSGDFVALNCATVPSGLVEAELFGYETGAFTDAKARTPGLFHRADKGVLFLDEVGDLPPDTQPKLLRVLQEKKVRRVGGGTEEDVDVRIISATNRDIRACVKGGSFRDDLFQRLKGFEFKVPPLRDRMGDIPELVDYFLRKFCAVSCRSVRLSNVAMRLLERYNWPGNVRELETVIDRAVALVQGSEIRPEDLPDEIREPKTKTATTGKPGKSAPTPPTEMSAAKAFRCLQREFSAWVSLYVLQNRSVAPRSMKDDLNDFVSCNGQDLGLPALPALSFPDGTKGLKLANKIMDKMEGANLLRRNDGRGKALSFSLTTTAPSVLRTYGFDKVADEVERQLPASMALVNEK